MTVLSARFLSKTALTAAIALLIGSAHVGSALAQDSDVGDDYEDKPRTSTMSGSAAAAAERARQRKAEAANKQPELFPQATRKPPEKKVTQKDAKTVNELQAMADAGKHAELLPKADAFMASSQSAYLVSFVAQLAATAAIKLDDQQKGADYYLKSVESNGLDNNGHYQIMYNLAVTLQEVERFPEALTWIDRYLAETKNESESALGLKAYVLSRLDRAAEGAALYEKLLAANPDDANILMNAVSMYQQADNNDKANALLEKARKEGRLKDVNAYRTLFISYVNSNKYKEAEEVLLDGVAKGVIQPSQTLANDYSIIAQNYYAEEKIPQTIDFYTRAAKVATNGEPSLNLAKVLSNENRMGEAKAAAREALAKGVKKPQEANNILAKPGK